MYVHVKSVILVPRIALFPTIWEVKHEKELLK